MNNNKKSNFKVLIFYIVLIAAIIFALSLMFSQQEVEEIKYSEVVDYFKYDAVKSFTVDENDYISLEVYDIDEVLALGEEGNGNTIEDLNTK